MTNYRHHFLETIDAVSGKILGQQMREGLVQYCMGFKDAVGVLRFCVGDASCQWEGRILIPHRSESLKSTAKRFGTVDYVRVTTLHAIFTENPFPGTSEKMGEI